MNLVFDSLLKQLSNTDKCYPIAYADNFAILVTGNSRNQIEDSSRRAVQLLDAWCIQHKMILSTDKTVDLLLKGKLDKERLPRINFQNRPLRFHQHVKYLGVIIDTQTKFTSHSKYVADKAKNLVNKYAAICGLNWGVPFKEMATIYRGSFVPVVSYAAYAWIDHLNSVTIRKIITAHRCALIRVTKSYRTTSTHLLKVLPNIQPIEHELQIEELRYCLRKSLSCSIYGKVYDTVVQNHKPVIQLLKTDLTTKWNDTWQTSTLGRTTYDFFPSANERKTRRT